MTEGNCRLCTKYGKLTFEHVPPRVTFNKHTRFKIINYIDYLKQDNPFAKSPKVKIEQGGIGYYTLCSTCNSFLGTNYVPAYQRYSNTFIDFAKKKDLNAFELVMHDFTALKVLKQIISMFFSFNDQKFSEDNRDLAEFILDPNSKELPKRFRVFNYLNTEGQLRNIPLMALGSFKTEGIVLGTELAFPPLGHLMTIDFNGQLPYHQEITSFKDFDISELATFDFKIFRLPTHLPILLDYRDKSTIEKSIQQSK